MGQGSYFRPVYGLDSRRHWGFSLRLLALRQQLSIYQRKQTPSRLTGGDRWFWMTVSGDVEELAA
jgi:hypothetical protein